MALGVPAADVIAWLGNEPMNQALLTRALTDCDFLWNQLSMGALVFEGWYFAGVPSLNKRGTMHQILLHWSYATGLTIIDPSFGIKYEGNGGDLISWADLTPFVLGGKLPRK